MGIFADWLHRRRTARTDEDVQHTRAWTGLYVVVLGDAAIAVAAIVAVVLISHHSAAPAASGQTQSGGIDTSSIVSILSAGFTAIGTMTTAYFGIRAASNTAQTSMNPKHPGGSAQDGVAGSPNGDDSGTGGDAPGPSAPQPTTSAAATAATRRRNSPASSQ
jgi:hypothetical protein